MLSPSERAAEVIGKHMRRERDQCHWQDDIAAAIREAVADNERFLCRALGFKVDESLHDYILRMQNTVNDQRELAVAEEREACAKVAEEIAEPKDYVYRDGYLTHGFDQAREDIAAAIRARSKDALPSPPP